MKAGKNTYKPGNKRNFFNIVYLLKNSLTKNLKVKIFGLLFAIIVWIYTILGNQYTHIFNVPLEIKNIVDGKTLKEPVPEKLKAEFTGKGSDFVFLYLSTSSSFKFELDLQNINYFYNFNLQDYYRRHPEKVILPRNMNVKFNQVVEPDSVKVELDFVGGKDIPVQPNIKLETEAGYIKSEPMTVNPESVRVMGPNFYVRQMTTIQTDSFHIRKLDRSIEADIPLKIPPKTTLNFSHQKVKISQRVEQIGEKIIKDIPVEIINKPEHKSIELLPETISLKVSAGLSHLTKLTADDFTIRFDYQKEWIAGENYYKPKIIQPAGVVDIIEVIPERLNVRVIRERLSK